MTNLIKLTYLNPVAATRGVAEHYKDLARDQDCFSIVAIIGKEHFAVVREDGENCIFFPQNIDYKKATGLANALMTAGVPLHNVQADIHNSYKLAGHNVIMQAARRHHLSTLHVKVVDVDMTTVVCRRFHRGLSISE